MEEAPLRTKAMMRLGLRLGLRDIDICCLRFSQIDWKNDPQRKPLLLLGARQVGKTWLMNEFGKHYFSKVAYIRFDRNERMRNVFQESNNVERLLLALQLEAGFKITAEDTLILFDEIQASPQALTSLKYFCEDAPEYAIIAAGSLLGMGLHAQHSFPVGKVNYLDLYPMSFSEFLMAVGDGPLADVLLSGDMGTIDVFGEKPKRRSALYAGAARRNRGTSPAAN